VVGVGVGRGEPDAGVSTPTGVPSPAATSAIDVDAPGGATSIQRIPSPMGASIRFSKPSRPV